MTQGVSVGSLLDQDMFKEQDDRPQGRLQTLLKSNFGVSVSLKHFCTWLGSRGPSETMIFLKISIFLRGPCDPPTHPMPPPDANRFFTCPVYRTRRLQPHPHRFPIVKLHERATWTSGNLGKGPDILGQFFSLKQTQSTSVSLPVDVSANVFEESFFASPWGFHSHLTYSVKHRSSLHHSRHKNTHAHTHTVQSFALYRVIRHALHDVHAPGNVFWGVCSPPLMNCCTQQSPKI